MTRPYSRVIEAVAVIATKLGVSVTNSGDRLADNLAAISGANLAALPTYPTENGAYVLTATKSATGVVLSWESAGE